jgi:UDP-N-acetylmuramoyl-tripeptide--D-alanyl-D-alanine ligase
MFFALKGENFNGNKFAVDAIERGALVAIVDDDAVPHHPKVIRVNDVLETLQHLAMHHRLQSRLPILAITGTNGKTTTKELCKAVLSEKFNVYATEGNLNNHIGVPLTLLSMDDDVEFGIVEMGANHAGEIAQLCEIAQPDFGLITNIGKAHLEGFGGIQGVIRAKSELFTFLMRHAKTVFVNEGNADVQKLVTADYPNAVRYNGNKGLEVKSIRSNPYLTLRIGWGKEILEINTRLLGGYNAENVVAAFCVGLHLGISTPAILRAIQDYQPRNSRSQLMDTGKNKIFLDAYNANPSSMFAAVNEFLLLEEPKKLLILGEMRELGDFSRQEHENIMNYLIQQGVEDVICVGQAFEQAALQAGYKYIETTDQLYAWLSEHPITGYFVFIKGSRSNRLEKLLPLL